MVAVLVLPLILTACGVYRGTGGTGADGSPGSSADGSTCGSRRRRKPESLPAAEGMYEDVDPSGQTVLWWHQHTRERQEGLNQMVEEFNADQRVGHHRGGRVCRRLSRDL